ncbi:4Fe-4S binding protein [Deferrisoma palaeochoriense]
MRPGARRTVQGLLFLGFLALFARTAYRGRDLLDWPVHLAFRLDPLAFVAEGFAVGAAAWTWLWLGAFVLAGAMVLLGRFFCGWMCPLGTALDLAGPALRRGAGRRGARARPPRALAPGLLAGLLGAALAGLPLLGVFDPLSLLLRSLTLALHPWADAGLKAGLGLLSAASPDAADRAYRILDPVLAFGRPAFLLAGVTAAVFAAVLALELLAPRFWCAHLCPLGAGLGLLARLGPVRRRKAGECGACTACERACPTGAARTDPADPLSCIQCGACERACPRGARGAGLGAGTRPAPVRPVRRAVLAAAGAGVVAGLFPRVRAAEAEPGLHLLRPPGARPEEEFRKRCIRCGACMRVCPRNALHPAFLEAGLGGIWTPRLVPRLGYCEYHCRLCGQVCPTGAIGFLAEGEKERWVIGLAVFDRNRCLPWRAGRNCLVCEEHCPTQPKAIAFEADPARPGVKLPRVVEDRCIGCGICEAKCPLPGRSAIRVTRENPTRIDIFF